MGTTDENGPRAAAVAGDEQAFAALLERHRAELRVHCYRMLGSFDEAEDLVQETFLRAWQHRHAVAGRATMRAWLYRIATNACLDALEGRARRLLPHHLAPPAAAPLPQAPRSDAAWLQPFPDRLLEPLAPRECEPDAVVVARETIELAFMAAIQHLPPRQRAVLLLRDVLGWSAQQTAALLGSSIAAVNSALQRARATLRTQLPARRLDWAHVEPSAQELAVLRRYMAAVEQTDLAAVGALLAEDIRTTMPPYPLWFQGRAAVLATVASSWDAASPGYVGRFHLLPVRANRQPAYAAYVCDRHATRYRAFAIAVLRIADGRITELTAFHDPGLFPAFALPSAL